jgi:hypothetical protein
MRGDRNSPRKCGRCHAASPVLCWKTPRRRRPLLLGNCAPMKRAGMPSAESTLPDFTGGGRRCAGPCSRVQTAVVVWCVSRFAGCAPSGGPPCNQRVQPLLSRASRFMPRSGQVAFDGESGVGQTNWRAHEHDGVCSAIFRAEPCVIDQSWKPRGTSSDTAQTTPRGTVAPRWRT